MQTKITQEDIFNYLFNKEKLSHDKIEFLDSNRTIYQAEIDLCKEMFSETSDEITEIAGSVSVRIKNYQATELFPKTIPSEENDGIKLAAATSTELKFQNASSSYCDTAFRYLVRIVNHNSYTQMYIFPQMKETGPLSVKIYPSENEYSIMDLSKPLEILPEFQIDKIVIKSA